jgi:hypothetical protein
MFEVAIEYLPSRFPSYHFRSIKGMVAIMRDDKLIAYRYNGRHNVDLYVVNNDGSYSTMVADTVAISDEWLRDMYERGLSATEYRSGLLSTFDVARINFARTRRSMIKLLNPYLDKYVGDVDEHCIRICREAVVESTGPCFAGIRGRFFYRLTPTDDEPGEYGECNMKELTAKHSHFAGFSSIAGHTTNRRLVGNKSIQQ